MVSYYHHDNFDTFIEMDSLFKVKISNSEFEDNKGLFYSINGHYNFENCNLSYI